MVKLDATRNYYADLGVPANADENDIRKAFRQLALKCHPDRNPGRENEFVAKFQQIQAAHEVLSDPAQRSKYDTERRKYRNLNIPPYNPNTPRTRPPPPPRNAYTTTPSGSYYRPPPPKPKPSPQRPPPPQHHTTFANGAERFTSKNFRAPPTAQRPENRQKDADVRANVFSAWEKMRKPPRAEDPRYSGNNPNGAPFGHSNSTRVPSSKRGGFDPGTPGGDEGQARSAYRSNFERPDPSPPATAENVPYVDANRMRTPYFSTTSGERTSMFGEGVGRSASVRNSPTHMHRPNSSTDAGSYSDSGHRPQRNSYGGHSKKEPFPHMYVSSDEEEAEVFRSGKKHRDRPSPKASSQQQPGWTQGPFGTPQSASPPNGPTQNAFKSKSEESINIKFSPSDWHGKFVGKPDYLDPTQQKSTPTRKQTSPTRGRPPQRTATERNPLSGQSQPPTPVSPFSQTQSAQMPPPPPPPPPSNEQPAFPFGADSMPHATKFAPEAWAEYFKEGKWALPTDTKETSPRRGSTSTKRPPTRKPSLVATGSSGSTKQSKKSKPMYQAFAEDASNGDVDAMDIDSNTPPPEKAKVPPPPKGKPKATPKSKSTRRGTGIGPNNGETTAPSAATAAPPPSALNGLGVLGNVEPFLPTTNGGLGGLDALKDTLPFKSQPSSTHPTKPNTAEKLTSPSVPAAPTPPQILDKASVDAYFTRMEGYVKQYKQFCAKMSNMFAVRNRELDFELDDHFIHHRGETTKKLGFNSYLNRIKADEEAMTVWKVAQEKHIKAMEECEAVRNKTMKQTEDLEYPVRAFIHPVARAWHKAFGECKPSLAHRRDYGSLSIALKKTATESMLDVDEWSDLEEVEVFKPPCPVLRRKQKTRGL